MGTNGMAQPADYAIRYVSQRPNRATQASWSIPFFDLVFAVKASFCRLLVQNLRHFLIFPFFTEWLKDEAGMNNNHCTERYETYHQRAQIFSPVVIGQEGENIDCNKKCRKRVKILYRFDFFLRFGSDLLFLDSRRLSLTLYCLHYLIGRNLEGSSQ